MLEPVQAEAEWCEYPGCDCEAKSSNAIANVTLCDILVTEVTERGACFLISLGLSGVIKGLQGVYELILMICR